MYKLSIKFRWEKSRKVVEFKKIKKKFLSSKRINEKIFELKKDSEKKLEKSLSWGKILKSHIF